MRHRQSLSHGATPRPWTWPHHTAVRLLLLLLFTIPGCEPPASLVSLAHTHEYRNIERNRKFARHKHYFVARRKLAHFVTFRHKHHKQSHTITRSALALASRAHVVTALTSCTPPVIMRAQWHYAQHGHSVSVCAPNTSVLGTAVRARAFHSSARRSLRAARVRAQLRIAPYVALQRLVLSVHPCCAQQFLQCVDSVPPRAATRFDCRAMLRPARHFTFLRCMLAATT